MSDSPVASPGLTSASSSRVMRVTSLLDGLRARRPLAFLDESHFRLTNVTRQLLHSWPPGKSLFTQRGHLNVIVSNFLERHY